MQNFKTSSQLIICRQHSEGGFSYPTSQHSKLLGLCTGTFAAAAISCSQDLVQLIPAAVHAVVVALHTGLRSQQESLSVDSKTLPPQYSMVVLGASESEIVPLLERFNLRNVSPIKHDSSFQQNNIS